MSEIIRFPETKENQIRRNNEDSIDQVQDDLGVLIEQTPSDVYNIINNAYVEPSELTLVNMDELQQLTLDYIFFQVRESEVSLEGESTIFAIQYVSELLNKIMLGKDGEIQLVTKNPYYNYWMNEGFPKRAGDASVYSYMFRDFTNKPINRDDYIGLAGSGYAQWSKDSLFPFAVTEVLPEIGGMLRDNDFLNRGPVREL